MTIEETIAGVLPSGKQDPIILATSFSATGHFTPLLQISGHLADKGYDVVFLGPHAWKANIENAGCDFIPTVGAAATPLNPADYPGYAKSGLANVLWIYRDAWAGTMPAYLESLRTALASIRRTHPHRDVVIMMDVYNPGIIPLKLGASLPDGYTTLPKTLGISILPPIFTTADRGPWGFGLPYDGASESARLRNIALCHAFRAVCEPAVEATNAMLRVCGVRTPIDEVWTGKFAAVPHVPVDYGIMCHDATLQMCIPSLEYPVDEFPPHFRFGGTLPPKPMPDGFQIPDKFQQVIENSHHSESWKTVAGRKRVVTVAQGTLAVDYSDLITPTIRGLESRDDIILVVILGVKGATLSQEFPEGLPTNTIVVDYFPYDPLIQHTDVFVNNGSYGALSHAVAHGVPMILAGHSEDKPEIGMRGERAGFAVNLRTGNPTPAMIAAAVDRVLVDSSFKRRAMELKQEAEEFRCLDTVERELRALF